MGSLPGLACKGCADLCGKMNCNWIKDLCSGCGNCVVVFHTKPLSSYVIISFILSGVAGYCAYSASSEGRCKFKSDAMVDLPTFCYIILACAVVNILFAFYFQMEVWKQIKGIIQKDYVENSNTDATIEIPEESYASKMKRTGGGLLAQGMAQARGQAEQTESALLEEGLEEIKYKVRAQAVQDGFKKSFMEDFGVLIFFLATLGLMVLCYFASTYVKENSPPCADNDMEGWTYYMGYGFFAIPFVYTFLWYCCSCCAKAVPISASDLEDLKNTAPAGVE